MPRILVIDDEQDVREVVSATLRAAGHQVFDAVDGAAGLAFLHADSHQIDLVITDILMPEKEGLETIAEIRKLYPRVKIIAMTGGGKKIKSTGGLLFTAEQVGAHAILMKPFSAGALYAKIHGVLTEPRR